MKKQNNTRIGSWVRRFTRPVFEYVSHYDSGQTTETDISLLKFSAMPLEQSFGTVIFF